MKHWISHHAPRYKVEIQYVGNIYSVYLLNQTRYTSGGDPRLVFYDDTDVVLDLFDVSDLDAEQINRILESKGFKPSSGSSEL